MASSRTWIVTVLLAAVLALTLALAPRAEGYVYWANQGIDGGRGSIGRANLDGTGAERDFITTGNGACGIAVDSAHIYWTNLNSDTIGRSNLDGTGVNESFIASPTGCGVAVDDTHVYWVSKFTDASDSPRTGAIGRANLDGTGVDESFITGVSFPSGPLAVDGSHLYWTSYHPSSNPFGLYVFPTRIARAGLDGAGVEESFITDAFGGTGLAVDDTHVWWAWADRFHGGIGRVNLDGTGVETSVIGGGEDFFAYGVAVDDTHVYWRGGFHSPVGLPIGRAKLDGSRANHEFITGTGANIFGGVTVDGLGPPPTNQFSFGKVKKNKRKGTARLTVKIPGSGELQLAKNKKVKGKKKEADAAGKHKLPLKPRRKAKQKLAAKGKAKVKAKVTYTPDGSDPTMVGNTDVKTVKLIKR